MRYMAIFKPGLHKLAVMACLLVTMSIANKLKDLAREFIVPLYAPKFHLQQTYVDYVMARYAEASPGETADAGLGYLISWFVTVIPLAYCLSCVLCELLARFPPRSAVKSFNLTRRGRLILLGCIGGAGIVMLAVVLYHPFSRVLIWPDLEFAKYVKKRDSASLIRLMNAEVLPYKIRARAFQILAGWSESKFDEERANPVYFSDGQVDRLAKEFARETFDFSFCLRRPVVEGKGLNPRIVSIVLDEKRDTTERSSAFCHLLAFEGLSPDQYAALEDLWQQIESEQLRCALNNLASYYIENGCLPGDVFQELGKQERKNCTEE